MLIAIEGIDGSGKTSLAERLGSSLPSAEFVSRKTLAAGSVKGMEDVLESLRSAIWSRHDFEREPIGALYWYYKLLAWYAALQENAVAPALRRSRYVFIDGWIYRHTIKAAMRSGLPTEKVECCAQFLAIPDKVILLEVDVRECWNRRSTYSPHETGSWDGFNSASAKENYFSYQSRVQDEFKSYGRRLGWSTLANIDQSLDKTASSAAELISSWSRFND